MFGSGTTTLIITNEEMNAIMKKTTKNEAKEQKREFLEILLDTLGASLLGNLLTGKIARLTSQGWGTIRAGEGTFRAGQDF